jgi:hypothetical protein
MKKKIIQQTLNFESNMYKLSFKHCCICHQRRLNIHQNYNKIFCLAFPWLFPGGIGDIKESRECDINIADWAQNLIFYEDGRFAKDNLWCFFVINYIQRQKQISKSMVCK